MTERTVTRTFGAQSLVAPLREALVKRPGPAFGRAFDDPAHRFLHAGDLSPPHAPPRAPTPLRAGKAKRRGEEAAHGAWYRARGIPVIGRIEAPGTVDGGDTFWLDRETFCIGRTLRPHRNSATPP